MPARAAARVEQAAKKSRTETPLPPDHRTATPSSVHNSTPAPEDIQEPARPPPPPLPTSIQPGRPLPTIEDPQPEDLPNKEYQTIQERYGASIHHCHRGTPVSHASRSPSRLYMLTVRFAVVSWPSHFHDRAKDGSARFCLRNTGRSRQRRKVSCRKMRRTLRKRV